MSAREASYLSQVPVEQPTGPYPSVPRFCSSFFCRDRDRYTNAEWAQQIDETCSAVIKEMNSGERAKKIYEGPRMRNGEAALRELAVTIDHTVLKLDATGANIDGICSEARTERFKSVCVRLPWVQRCISNLKGSGVVVACVVGFHEGTQDTHSKLREARAAVAAGAAELDVVLNHSILTKHNEPVVQGKEEKLFTYRDSAIDSITAANTTANARSGGGGERRWRREKEGEEDEDEGEESEGRDREKEKKKQAKRRRNRENEDEDEDEDEEETAYPDYSAIYRELASIRSLCPNPIVLKLILETSQLSWQQILAASHLAAAAAFDFTKTSTGFNGPGATLPHVQLMVAGAEYLAARRIGRGKMAVKASGGIRDLTTAVSMLEAGASRLGTSSGLWIMQEARKRVGQERGKRGGLKGRAMVVEDNDDEEEERPTTGMTRLYTDDSLA